MSLSLKEVEEYGKIVQYNSDTGEFRDISTTIELKPYQNRPSDLLTMNRYRNCSDCQWESTFGWMGQRNAMLNKKIQEVDEKDMFYYLTGNFLQHAGNTHKMIWQLENIYKNGTSEMPGKYNFPKGSEFDLLLENLVTKSPCFKRALAHKSTGWTLLRVLELCFIHQMKDVNYSTMILNIFLRIENEPRFDFIVAQLKRWPYYRINSLLDNTLIPCTIANRIPFVDQVTNRQCFKYLEHLLDPRSAHIKMHWKCKRLFFVAKYKPARDCPFSAIPMDILKYILYFAEIISLPRAVSFQLTKEEENKIKATQPLTFLEKMKKIFF